MDRGFAISASLHALVIGLGLVTFGSATPLVVEPTESMPVDIMSLSEFTQLTRGQKQAPRAETPKQIAEKVGEDKPPETEAKKISEKPPIDTAAAPPPPPKVEAPAPPPMPPQRAEKPPEPEAKKEPEPPRRPEPPKPAPRPQEAKPQPPQPQPQPQQRNFDSNAIAALLDRRDPTRAAATGATPSQSASLGSATGNAPKLSQTEIDALRAQIQRCWNPPVGAADARDLVVRVRLALNQDGSLSGNPSVVNRGASPFFQVAAESATRAIRRCAPYNLPAAKYEAWRDVEVTFDPRDMFRG